MGDFLPGPDAPLCERSRQELDQVIYRIIHDLRASVRAIAELPNWIEEDLIEEGIALSAGPRESLDLLKTHAKKLNMMLDTLSHHAHRDDICHSSTSVKACLDYAIGCLPSANGLTARANFSPETVRLPQAMVQSILLIILKNAVQHNASAVKVALIAKQRKGVWELAVRDSGAGLATSHLNLSLVEEIKPNATGSNGKGLSLLRYLVLQSKGEFTLLAPKRKGQGATIFVSIPIESVSDV